MIHQRLPLLPAAAFVLVWSSGYISGPAAVYAAAPFWVLGWRFTLAAVLAALIALALRRPTRMNRAMAVQVAGVGLVMNALQFGLMYVAFDLGLGPTVSALLHALSPVLTLLLAAGLMHEGLGRLQVVGFGLGVAGVLIVLGPDVDASGGLVAVAAGVASMLALSLGTLGQRWIGGQPDLLWSACLQFTVAAPVLLVASWTFEGWWPVTDQAQAIGTVVFLAVINSVVGLILLALLVVRGGSGAAASLFFLAPPVTALLAWLWFAEVLGWRGWLGLAVSATGVALATRSRRPVPDAVAT